MQRIRAAGLGAAAASASRLQAEGMRLAAGRTLRNRRTAAATALIVVRGALRVGAGDDAAALTPGEGVLLPAGTAYSLQAVEEVAAVLFALLADGPDAAPADGAVPREAAG